MVPREGAGDAIVNEWGAGMKERRVLVSVYLPRDLHARVVSVAAARGLTKTAVLEAAVQWLLRTPGLGAEGGARPGRGAEAGHGRTGGR